MLPPKRAWNEKSRRSLVLPQSARAVKSKSWDFHGSPRWKLIGYLSKSTEGEEREINARSSAAASGPRPGAIGRGSRAGHRRRCEQVVHRIGQRQLEHAHLDARRAAGER